MEYVKPLSPLSEILMSLQVKFVLLFLVRYILRLIFRRVILTQRTDKNVEENLCFKKSYLSRVTLYIHLFLFGVCY